MRQSHVVTSPLLTFLRHLLTHLVDCLSFFAKVSGSFILYVDTSAKFRDTTGWYHIVARCDTTNGTANIYVNGEEITNLATNTKPSGSQSLPDRRWRRRTVR